MKNHVISDRYAEETDVSKLSSFRKTILKGGQDSAAEDARVLSELTVCPWDQQARAGRFTYRLFSYHWKVGFSRSNSCTTGKFIKPLAP